MSEQKRVRRYPVEVRERAVRMVFEHQDEYPSQWKAIESIAGQLGLHRETLRLWVRRAETDAGERPGLASDERARLKELERQNKELRRANEILKAGGCRTNVDHPTRVSRRAGESWACRTTSRPSIVTSCC
jgi:transposase